MGAPALLTACSTSDSGAEGLDLSPAAFRSSRFAAIAAQIDDGPEALMILVNESNGRLRWLSKDRIGLITQNGRIVKTIGLGANLVAITSHGPNAARIHDLDHPSPHGVAIYAESGEEQPATPPAKGWFGDGPFQRQTEMLTSPDINWSGRNSFVRDQSTGLIVASSQSPVPFMPPIHIRLLKPAASGGKLVS